MRSWLAILFIMTMVSAAQGADESRPSQSASSSSQLPLQDLKNLARDFSRAQKSELQALEHQQALQKVELASAQRAQLNDWEKKELKNRHEFFDTHPKGTDRRDYVKDFVARRAALLKAQAEERTQNLHEQDLKRNSLREDQIVKAKEFSEYLEKGEVPPKHLWPASQ